MKQDSNSAVAVAQGLYQQILDTGMRFQVLNTDRAIRYKLLQLARATEPFIVESADSDNEKVLGQLTALRQSLEELQQQVPSYSLQRNGASASKAYAAGLVRLINEKSALLAPLEEQSKEKQQIRDKALARIREVNALRSSDPSWIKMDHDARNAFSIAQEEVRGVGDQIQIITFFGADLLHNGDK